MSLESDALKTGITNDLKYSVRFARNLNSSRSMAFQGVIALCMAPYLSLFVHESYKKIRALDPTLPSLFSEDARSIVERSRHSLKLFEDTERKVEGQLDYFRDKIFPAHSNSFLGHAQPQLALFLETDLGLFSYGGKLITTTHSATFHLGVDPVTLLTDGSGAYLRSIYEEYGRYFGASEADAGAHIDTFISCLDSENFNRWPDDVRADRYYRRMFNGEDTPDLNALLTVFRGMMNFVDSVIGASDGTRGIEYTVFKIRYLTLYHVLRSLRILSDERPRDLTERSVRSIDKITQTPEVELILDPAVRPFRNTLTHYSLDSRVDVAKIDVSEPLFGLVPIYFPSHNTATFNETVNRCIRATAIVMEEWAAA